MPKNHLLKQFCINLILILIIIFILQINTQPVQAAPSLKITKIYAKRTVIQYKKQRIYIKILETSNQDFWGTLYIKFYTSNNQIYTTTPKELTVLAGQYAYLFWDISFPIAGILKSEIIIDKTKTPKAFIPIIEKSNKYLNVYYDNDKDGIPNINDPDDDNDGLPDTQEKELETNPYNPDTDADGTIDPIDAFPTNPKEWKDTDNDGIGDNEDPDIDNDGLTNEQEKLLGTNPYNPDTDGDDYTDGQEVESKSNPTNPKSTPTPIQTPPPSSTKPKPTKLHITLPHPISIKKIVQKLIHIIKPSHKSKTIISYPQNTIKEKQKTEQNNKQLQSQNSNFNLTNDNANLTYSQKKNTQSNKNFNTKTKYKTKNLHNFSKSVKRIFAIIYPLIILLIILVFYIFKKKYQKK